MSLSAAEELHCLSYDPFAGDFGDQGDKILSDKMVTAAKDRPFGACCICFSTIAKGERHRVQTGRIDGALKECRMCGRCCVAMANTRYDDGDAIELRTELGMRRSGAMARKPEPELTEAVFFAEKARERVGQATEGMRNLGDSAAGATEAIQGMSDTLEEINAPRRIGLLGIVAVLAIFAALAVVFRLIASHHGG